MTLPLKLLLVSLVVRQEGGDVEHDLIPAVAGVDRVLTRLVLCNNVTQESFLITFYKAVN